MNFDRRRLVTGLAALPVVSAAPVLARSAGSAPAELALDAAFTAHAPVGLAGAIVGREGLVWSSARGLRRLDGPEPVTSADRWHLGSNTKAMTAAVFARLVEQGRARWSMPLAEVFPAVVIDPGWANATLDDFMHHRAGLADAAVMGREWLMTARQDPRSLPAQRAAIAAAALGAPPPGAPGQFAYGNANYVLVGAAIERITGGSWEDAMRSELFAPLGLPSAGFGAPEGDDPWGHRGAAAQRTPMPPDHRGADNPAALGPAGTAHMSLADYGRFIAAMMGARPDWLGGESLARLTTPPAALPPPAYACGWGVREEPWGGASGPGPVLGHDGSNTMWYCSVQVAPQRGLAVLAVANEGAAGRPACQDLAQRLVGAAVAA
ncbi:serine hydrolase domain-containing protein [Brevundimonas viscosa]|uniref:CubicO group peptidase, beta-lactamase class C family n=1 Tax=Brevundimonas viscosa TaxID=871741 RepID=A0A1I6QG88_9CAUL|nr:serine hydrolase domain-containing protein [Brevundimonas viscosa]SFS51513.1 CubicO group peptidase, beta-lactamase class C family [Brevundimonas viscosa]